MFNAATYVASMQAIEDVSYESHRHDLRCRGYQLPVQYVIHAVGPIYDDYSPEEAKELLVSAHRCYTLHNTPHSFYQFSGRPACV